MKKALIVLSFLFLFGCGNQNMELNSPKSSETVKEANSVAEIELLPFNVSEVVNDYESSLTYESDATLNVDDTEIFMVDGDLGGAQTLLGALNKHIGDGEEIDEIGLELLEALKMDQSYENDFIIDDILIRIEADEPRLIKVRVTNN